MKIIINKNTFKRFDKLNAGEVFGFDGYIFMKTETHRYGFRNDNEAYMDLWVNAVNLSLAKPCTIEPSTMVELCLYRNQLQRSCLSLLFGNKKHKFRWE